MDERKRFRPLDKLTLLPHGKAEVISVRDGRGREYWRGDARREHTLTLGGALGTQLLFYLDNRGAIIEEETLTVEGKTEIHDGQERFGDFLETLKYTMLSWWSGTDGFKYIRLGGKTYKYYVSWLRDHVHSLKGMRYFDDDLKTGIDLYTQSQRDDGMIWDKCKAFPRNDIESYNNVQARKREFGYGDFWREIPEYPSRA